MSVLQIKLSDAELKRQAKEDINELTDPTLPLRVRFWSNREKATIFLIEYIGGVGKWHRLGYWPSLTMKSVLSEWGALQKKFLLSGTIEFNAYFQASDLFTWYQERALSDKSLSKHRKYNTKSIISKHMIPLLGGFEIKALTVEIIEDSLIWPLQNRYRLSTVQQYFKLLKRVFRQAFISEKISVNPLASMRFKDFIDADIKPKPCAIASHDLKNIFGLMKYMPFEASFLVLTMLAFGMRIGETRQLKYSYIETDQQQWHLPETITKTVALITPITPWYQKLLQQYQDKQKRLNGYTGAYLFPSGNGKCINENLATEYIQSISQHQWTSHDCRKIARTTWQELGGDYFVCEQLLNHKMKDLDERYIQSSLTKLKRELLEKWHFFLAQKMTEKNQDNTKIVS